MENLTIEAYEEKIDLYHFKNKESKKILEVYSNQIKEDIKNISRLIREIDNFMKLFNIILDEKRNKYFSITVDLGILSLVFTICLFIPSLFSMNLYYFPDDGENFEYSGWIVMFLVCISIIPIYCILQKCIHNKLH